MVNITPAKHHYITLAYIVTVTVAFSSKYCSAQVQPHKSASMSVDSCSDICIHHDMSNVCKITHTIILQCITAMDFVSMLCIILNKYTSYFIQVKHELE